MPFAQICSQCSSKAPSWTSSQVSSELLEELLSDLSFTWLSEASGETCPGLAEVRDSLGWGIRAHSAASLVITLNSRLVDTSLSQRIAHNDTRRAHCSRGKAHRQDQQDRNPGCISDINSKGTGKGYTKKGRQRARRQEREKHKLILLGKAGGDNHRQHGGEDPVFKVKPIVGGLVDMHAAFLGLFAAQIWLRAFRREPTFIP